MQQVILSGLIFFLLLLTNPITAQDNTKFRTLRNCIDYALEHNIQVQKSKVNSDASLLNYEAARYERLPSLSAGADAAISHQQPVSGDVSAKSTSLTGNYSMHSDLILYNGSKLTNAIKQDALQVKSAELYVQENENSIELAVTASYFEILFAEELVKNAENNLESSRAQTDRAKVLFEAGYIAESNYAQVRSQYSNDVYTLTNARNSLEMQILSLKQLLELEPGLELNLDIPALEDTEALKLLPEKETVLNAALMYMPEIENSNMAIKSAELAIRIAKAGYLPSLSLGASLSTGSSNAVSSGFTTQLSDNFYQNVGLSLSIPIFSKKQVKTSVSQARLDFRTAELSGTQVRKELVNKVESVYLDAVSSQGRLRAAIEQMNSGEVSYRLVEEQFNLGMKNTVELLTEKTKYLNAQQEYLQAKYSAIYSYKLLDFYQQKHIDL